MKRLKKIPYSKILIVFGSKFFSLFLYSENNFDTETNSNDILMISFLKYMSLPKQPSSLHRCVRRSHSFLSRHAWRHSTVKGVHRYLSVVNIAISSLTAYT